ncbi:amino acid ABC transporter permease [Halalkalibacterium halodurans]|uniref:ABC transporter (Permease) n=1 Tax=Halalkalibacterium halodurans (strain ATCC BAA-125 / DSM 18197 / FERM 7344 / JCM 9153 / C-125) TaxID=272558 RepID=Q9KCV7_HALH5|nr:amino acid ABC transporter permease [Halalkalibacterium halodurans]MED4173339.1 amino acid ABC transporter permease [Halalkalibacterium halodurans]BAB05181.1 ABC transporter (permease) [Halalkalibacterium halodurans C-125]
MSFDFSRIQPFMPFMLEGVWVTLQFVSVSLLFGLVLGIVLAIFKISKYRLFRWFADFYTSIFRGTPLILQLLMIYLALPQFGVDISQFQAAFLAFGLNSAAYVSEIIRAGIQAVDKGQREAAEALGIPYRPMMLRIILPQAMRNILPALFNEFINLTKESAIVSVIGVTDLMRRAQITSAETYLYLEPLLFVGLIYYVLVMGLTVIGRLLERRLKRSD